MLFVGVSSHRINGRTVARISVRYMTPVKDSVLFLKDTLQSFKRPHAASA